MKRTISVPLFLVAIVALGNIFTPNNVITSPSNQKRTINLTIQLVFIGYDENILDTSSFTEFGGVYDYYPDIETIGQYNISIETTLIEIESEYYLGFLTYIESIANFSATTSELNITLLEEDNIDPTDGIKSDIFYERTGVSINTTLVLDYLNDNPPTGISLNPWNYGLYFLNLSVLDTGATEHWYDVSETNIDTEQPYTDWYSEYTGLYDRPVPGWGGEGDSRIIFFDPSALEAIWYFDWIITDFFWSFTEYSNSYVYTDLEDYIDEHETFQPSDNSLEDYLYNFTYDILYNDLLVRPYAVLTPDVQDLYFEIAVIENFTRGSIYTQEDLEFIVNPDKILEAFEELLPFFEIHVNIHWYSLEDYPEIEDLFDSATTVYEDYYQIEVTEGSPQSVLEYLYENLGTFVDIHPVGLNFPTMTFLINKTRMSYLGTRFGGLGGMEWQLLAYQWDRFMDTTRDPPVPKTGVSDTIIHEAGHTLGFGHPHHGNYWIGDFIDSLMSYYTLNSYFSKFERDWIQSLLVQELLFGVINDYEILGQSYSLSSPEVIATLSQDVEVKLDQALNSFKEMNFSSSFTQAREAAIIVETLAGILEQIGNIETTPMTESEVTSSTSAQATTESKDTSTSSIHLTIESQDAITTSDQSTALSKDTSTPIPIGAIIIALPILLIYKKKQRK